MGALLAAAIAAQFTIDARVVEAVDGGPLIVEVTATYNGSGPLRYQSDPFARPVEVELPPDLPSFRLLPPAPLFYAGPGPAIRTVSPGESFTYRLAVHQMFTGPVPRGVARLNVLYTVHAHPFGDDRPANVVTLRKSTPVSVEAFAPRVTESVRRNVARIAATRPAPGEPLEHYHRDLADQAERIVGTQHAALIPAAIDLLRASPSQPTRYALRMWLWRMPGGASRLHDLDLVTLRAGATDPGVATEVFDDWRVREMTRLETAPWLYRSLRLGLLDVAAPARGPDGRLVLSDKLGTSLSILGLPSQRLPDEHLRRLSGEKSAWLRAYTYITFSGRLDSDWRDRLLADLTAHSRVAPDKGAAQEPLEDALLQWLASRSFRSPARDRVLAVLAAGHPDRQTTRVARDLVSPQP